MRIPTPLPHKQASKFPGVSRSGSGGRPDSGCSLSTQAISPSTFIADPHRRWPRKLTQPRAWSVSTTPWPAQMLCPKHWNHPTAPAFEGPAYLELPCSPFFCGLHREMEYTSQVLHSANWPEVLATPFCPNQDLAREWSEGPLPREPLTSMHLSLGPLTADGIYLYLDWGWRILVSSYPAFSYPFYLYLEFILFP